MRVTSECDDSLERNVDENATSGDSIPLLGAYESIQQRIIDRIKATINDPDWAGNEIGRGG